MALKDWKIIQNKHIGNDISIIYKNKNLTLELFKDSAWGKTNNMNVIIRDKNIESYASSLGKSIEVERKGSKAEALNFAKSYMRSH